MRRIEAKQEGKYRSVQTGTQGEKYQAKSVQYGRSMVEMLGVLALIGVLSVGGIAGYNKAMWMYKSNKQAEQMSQIISAINRYKDEVRINDRTTPVADLTDIFIATGDIPEDMLYSSNWIKDVTGTRYSIYHHDTGYVGMQSSLRGLPDGTREKVCQNLYRIAQQMRDEIDYIQITKYFNTDDGSDSRTFGKLYGNRFCSEQVYCLKDMKISDIPAYCSVCEDSDEQCMLYFIWR